MYTLQPHAPKTQNMNNKSYFPANKETDQRR